MSRLKSLPAGVGDTLLALWRTRMGKVTAVLLVLSFWVPALLVIPGIYYGVRIVRLVMRRLLYSVRAKLVAFYLYSALLPIVLVATILLFVGYVVLGQVSARVIETRLDALTQWSDERSRVAESVYWRSRARGLSQRSSAVAALDSAYGGITEPAFACWVLGANGELLEARGPIEDEDVRIPRWLGTRRFVGMVASRGRQIELRSRLRLADPPGALELSSVLPLGARHLNAGLAGRMGSVVGGLGAPGRDLTNEAPSESLAIREGIVAFLSPGQNITMTPYSLEIHKDPGAAGRPDSIAADSSQAKTGIRTRYPLLYWGYIGYPVAWETGRTDDEGPPIPIAFSVEGASRALLRTGVGVQPVIGTIVLIVVGFLALLQLIATLRGFSYARAISDSVAKLDRGVRAIRSGNFGYRVQPREDDQLGALTRAFNDMSHRLEGLLEERTAHEAVEREIEIARTVQARLFPEGIPVSPFFEARGLCVPARSVSGDYYDFVEVFGGGLDAVVADVSGKGISAAILMASLQASLRSLYLGDGGNAAPDPALVVGRLNEQLHQCVEPARFVTLFLVRYLGDGQLFYCSAGHNPAALVRPGKLEWLSAGGLVLGPFPNVVYEATRVEVQPGELVCMYTDGVTEALSPTGEQFGEERLSRVLLERARSSPEEVLGAVQDEVHRFRGDAEASDDLTLVVLRITK